MKSSWSLCWCSLILLSWLVATDFFIQETTAAAWVSSSSSSAAWNGAIIGRRRRNAPYQLQQQQQQHISVGQERRGRNSLFLYSTKSINNKNDNDKKKRLHVDGSIVTIDCRLVPEGDFIPEPLIDGIFIGNNSKSNNSKNNIRRLAFVLGKGNYLPGLHALVSTMEIGEATSGVSIDAGWGSHDPQMVVTMDFESAAAGINKDQIKVGTELYLQSSSSSQMKCTVTEITDTTFTLDANPPLAGASYAASVTLLSVEDGPWDDDQPFKHDNENNNKYQVAMFALGCFWGAELNYQRHVGVVGTMVGYTQGPMTNNNNNNNLSPAPTYEEVCSGTTGFVEAVAVTYDSTVVSFETLVRFAMDDCLGEDKYLKNQVGNDKGTQYRHGIYYYQTTATTTTTTNTKNQSQKQQSQVALDIINSYGPECVTECLPATKFYPAEEYHQQYLLKGGQSARKNDTTTIRCYG